MVGGRSDRRAYEADLVGRSAAEAVAAERLALARDLHDIVSHGLGLITTRAAVARRLSHIDPDDLAVALDDIEHTSRATTTELRRMLTLLRTDTDAASLVPLPGLADIPDVVADAGRHHLTVDYTHNAGLSASAGVAATIFQIVKEGLANTLRHAGPTTVTIMIERVDDAITVAMADSGPAIGHRSEPAAGHGHGLVGLSERVTALGGTLDSGQVGSGGFQLGATIPDPPTDRRST